MSGSPVESLSAQLATISDARRRPEKDGAPDLPGIYAWWLASAAELPDLPAPPHPRYANCRLLYVGVAPKRASSAGTIRTRIKQHSGAGLADSTLRRSLTALLWERRDWTPGLTPGGRWKLPAEEDAALTTWQREHLRVSWLHIAEPWTSESYFIEQMGPPLNVADNATEPYYEQMAEARALFVAVAQANARRLEA